MKDIVLKFKSQEELARITQQNQQQTPNLVIPEEVLPDLAEQEFVGSLEGNVITVEDYLNGGTNQFLADYAEEAEYVCTYEVSVQNFNP